MNDFVHMNAITRNATILIGLFWITQSVTAQTLDDSLTTYAGNMVKRHFNPGIYKTFNEFRSNSPSVVDNYVWDGKKLWEKDPVSGKLKVIDKRAVWGFSDGTKVFVRWNKYVEIIEMGKYLFFIEKGVRIYLSFSVFPPKVFPIPIPYKDNLVIDYDTGQSYLLSKSFMKKMLAREDPELLADFKREGNKNRKLFEYIVRYNKRYVESL